MAEMKQCRCETSTHDHHRGTRCTNQATERDDYCKKCNELAADEFDYANPS